MVPINLTCPRCLQHFFFEHLFHLYIQIHAILCICLTYEVSVQIQATLFICRMIRYIFCVVRYFKVLIQEMQLKVDQGFLNNIIDMFSANQELTSEQQVRPRATFKPLL